MVFTKDCFEVDVYNCDFKMRTLGALYKKAVSWSNELINVCPIAWWDMRKQISLKFHLTDLNNCGKSESYDLSQNDECKALCYNGQPLDQNLQNSCILATVSKHMLVSQNIDQFR